MRVLLQCRRAALRQQGGEARQILLLREELAALGVSAEISSSLSPSLEGFGLVHLFNLTQPAETLAQATHARRAGVPIVLSPIYQDLREYDARGRYGLAAFAARLAGRRERFERWRDLARAIPAPRTWAAQWHARGLAADEQRRAIVTLCDGFLTNSEMEMRAIETDFGAKGAYRVATYGVAQHFFTSSSGRFLARWGDAADGAASKRELVVCAGFLSSLKNQHALIHALRGSGLTLALAGPAVRTHRAYARRLRREAAAGDPRVLLLGSLAPDDLASLLACAKVVVLPSWFETCGMACLEGAAAGANVVITNRGYTREYFGEFAWYCDPADVASIATAIRAAHAAPRRTDFAAHIREHYTWPRAARAALDLYRALLDCK